MKKIIFLDVDGTLVDITQNTAESSKEAVRKARENGHFVVLCTGRTHATIYPWLLEVGFDGIVASSGANVYWQGQELNSNFLEKEDLKKVSEVLEKYNAIYAFQGDKGRFTNQENADRMYDFFIKLKMNDIIEQFPVHVMEKPFEAHGIESGIYMQATAPVDIIQQEVGYNIRVTGASFGHDQIFCGEITAQNLHKASGMKVLIDHIGMNQKDVVAFGDGLNDLEMIEFANVGVAMGNAVSQLKDIADMVTDDINDNGLYNGFKKLKLI